MTILCNRRGAKVVENPQLRLGEIRFRPAQPGGVSERAEMSAATWSLIENDEDRGRAYLVARSRAMRRDRNSTMSLISPEARMKADALGSLERDVHDLMAAMRAVADLGDAGKVDLLQRRHALRTELLLVRDRFETVEAQFAVIDDLLLAKVLD